MRNHALILVAGLAACSGGDIPVSASGNRILVLGSDMGVLFENINLSRNNSPLTGAQVLVNGTLIAEVLPGHYVGQLPAPLVAGASVTLNIISGTDTVIGTTTVPTAPTVLAPTSGTAIHIPTPLDFTWIDATDPDEFVAGIGYSGTSEIASFGPSARSGIVVTSRIPGTATNLTAYVYAYGDGTFTGAAASGSKMHVRQPSQTVALTVGP